MRRPAPRMDALVLLAKASASRHRRRSLAGCLVIGALGLVAAVLLIWWLVPGQPASPLALALYDQVAQADEPIKLVAAVQPLDPQSDDENLSGCMLYFSEMQSGLQQKAATNRVGLATCATHFPAGETPRTVVASYPGDKRGKRRGVQAQGRVFVWPADGSLLVVDADRGLVEADEGALWTANNLDLRPKPDALRALRGLRASHRLVYLTDAGALPLRYNKLRALLESSWSPAQQFPDGPVLVAALPNEGKPARERLLSGLAKRFATNRIGVTHDVETARLFQQQGFDAYLIGSKAELPAGITGVDSWAALEKRLQR